MRGKRRGEYDEGKGDREMKDNTQGKEKKMKDKSRSKRTTD
jgi:hypothetical protein